MTVSRPTDFPSFATSGTNRTAPASGLITDGYANSAVPGSKNLNYLLGLNGDWAEYLDQERAAIAATVASGFADAATAQQLLAETQSAQTFKLVYSLGAHFARDVTMKFNNGSAAGLLLVGDSAYLATRVLGGALATRTPGSSYSGNFTACTEVNGVYVAVGSNAEVQTSTDGVTFTRRLSTGSDSLYCVATDGTKVLAGGQNGILYLASTATGTYNSMTNPAGSVAVQALGYDTTSSLWILTTFDGRIYTSATAANGSWTLKLTVTTSPAFLQGRLSQGGLGWAAIFTRNSGQYGHAYSTDHGVTWTQGPSVQGTLNMGDPTNVWSAVMDASFAVCDNTSPAVSFLTVGVFPILSAAPILTGLCKTIYGALTDNCLPFKLKSINDQLVLLAHDAPGGVPTNGFVYMTAPFSNV